MQRPYHFTIRVALLLCVAVIALVLLVFPRSIRAARSFPLVSLYYVDCCFSMAEAEDVAQFDLVILTMEAAEYNASGIERVRKLNPDIILLPYVPSQGIDFNSPSATRQALIDEVQDDWYLKNPQGTIISRYFGERDLNITRSDVQEALAQFVDKTLNDARCGSVHCWDGVFFDVVEDNVDYLGALDLNLDGQADSNVNTQWVQAYVSMFRRTRQLLGDNKTIVINGVSNLDINADVNGRMFENFPTPWHADGSWKGVVENSPTLRQHNEKPISIIYSAQGDRNQYKKVRYSLVSGLISGVYAGYDNGVDQHNSIWLYDEYSAVLGTPAGKAVNVLNPSDGTLRPGVWRRDFDKGIALLNSTQETRTITLDTGYEKLNGTQSKVNNGDLVGQITLKPEDGIILYKREAQLDNGPFSNGAFARVYKANGKRARTSFFPFQQPHAGRTRIVNVPEKNLTVVAGDTYVEVFKNGKRKSRFAPYGDQFRGGINIDVDQLGKKKKAKYRIVTGTRTGGSHVRVFNQKGKVIRNGCFPFDGNDGVNVAIGNILKKKPGKEIVVSRASGGSPEVRVLNKKCQMLKYRFNAYDSGMQGGVAIAAGDLTGDNKDEIVTIPANGRPHVRILNAKGRDVLPGFFAFDSSRDSESQIVVTDVEGDGINEIVPMTYTVFNF